MHVGRNTYILYGTFIRYTFIFPRLSRSNVMNTVLTVLAYTVLSALAKPESMKQYECLLCPMLYFSVV